MALKTPTRMQSERNWKRLKSWSQQSWHSSLRLSKWAAGRKPGRSIILFSTWKSPGHIIFPVRKLREKKNPKTIFGQIEIETRRPSPFINCEWAIGRVCVCVLCSSTSEKKKREREKYSTFLIFNIFFCTFSTANWLRLTLFHSIILNGGKCDASCVFAKALGC